MYGARKTSLSAASASQVVMQPPPAILEITSHRRIDLLELEVFDLKIRSSNQNLRPAKREAIVNLHRSNLETYMSQLGQYRPKKLSQFCLGVRSASKPDMNREPSGAIHFPDCPSHVRAAPPPKPPSQPSYSY
jgi:hypothetical protein